jgi:hypothetical protein
MVWALLIIERGRLKVYIYPSSLMTEAALISLFLQFYYLTILQLRYSAVFAL